jgi:predicted metal-dependent hydrolase
MKPHAPQLHLRLDAASLDSAAPWRAGGRILHLGASLTLVLDTTCRAPERVAGELHLPLPPGAAARQLRDAAESWLRDAALARFEQIVRQKSALAGRRAPHVKLMLGRCNDWVRRDGDRLRCHWRLIEQPQAIIEQVLGRALAEMLPAPACDDLFALV